MENISAIVGSNLSALRKAKGLTQQELASEIHYSDKSISKWELGYSCPSVDVLMDFAAYFGVSLEYLVAEHEEADAIEAVTPQEEEKDPVAANKAVIIGLTMMIVILADLSLFFSEFLFTDKEITFQAWSIFPWILPICSLLAAIEVRLFYRNRVAVVVLTSIFVWTLLLCLCLHYGVFSGTKEGVWFIMLLGIPIQVILLLLGNWKKSTKKKPTPSN